MNLLTDEQTIDDLRIFGRHDAGGIYDLYNNTHTRGGEKVLEEMFRHPLSDKDAINRRSSIIESFAGRHTAFPFQGAMLDMTEKYILSMDKGSMRENRQQVLSEKDISQGVTAVIELIQRISSFMEQPQAKDNIAYQQERLAITALLNTTAFEPVHREKQKGKIPYAAVAAYDLLFRTREIEKIKELLGYIYYLDVYLAVAKLASDRQFIFPKACDKGTAMLRLEGIYHPSLKDPVGNNIAMHAGRNVIFLTGANMAGKSTFLRALSTAMYIAHMGFPVAATAMEFSVMDGIYTTINLPDNLGIGDRKSVV